MRFLRFKSKRMSFAADPHPSFETRPAGAPQDEIDTCSKTKDLMVRSGPKDRVSNHGPRILPSNAAAQIASK